MLHHKENMILELTSEITDLKTSLGKLQEEKAHLSETNENMSNQLKMKEIQIVLNQELQKRQENLLEEGEIEKPFEQIDQVLTENDINLVKIVEKLINLR